MKVTHNLVQGTGPWDQFRLDHDGASEIAAVLGLSLKVKRAELLRMKKTGLAKEFSDWVQANVLDYGHEVEALARPLVEAIIGEDLYPVTCSNGRQSASCDGLTMDDRIAFEHKQWSEAMAAHIRATGTVPPEHMPQCQQVIKVTEAEKLIFVISDGTADKMLYAWVLPDPEWFQRIDAGWSQFHADLETFVPTDPVAEVVGRTPETLPALHIVLKGEVSASNLAEFKDVALTAIRSVNRDLKTDQDFADSAKARKWCEDIETRVSAAKEHALSQTATIDMLFRTMDEVSAEAREVRLALEKLEKARKESRRGEIVAGGVKAMADHMAALNTRLGKPYMPIVSADFGGSIKNLRTFDSMQNAVDTTLANAKIQANAVADKIQINLTLLRETAMNHAFLFADAASIVLKANDDFATLVKARIDAHTAAEAAKEEALRERLRQEELARIERERVAAEHAAEAKKIADDAAIQAAIQVEQRAKEQAIEAAIEAAQPPSRTLAQLSGYAMPNEEGLRSIVPATQPSGPPTLKLGTICERLSIGYARLSISAEFLKALGFEPSATEKGAKLFHEHEFPLICQALVMHIELAQARRFAA